METYCLYDTLGRCVKEFTTTDSGETLAGGDEYVYGNGFAELIAVCDASGGVEYALTDALGSVVCLAGSPAYISPVRYDAYGNAGDDTPDMPFGFAGMKSEPAADICLTPNRAYSPGLGRWLSPDPTQIITLSLLYEKILHYRIACGLKKDSKIFLQLL
ncbi:RHS repeat-associated core domain protein [Sedimentisphaera cyanobacteriorum]|uniref:RHS repeat-associated core domain protein n=1 Tax=Sedimentisphaera cyanobacteriorum TaxID=1940790 RepID=A0A1Q2HR23_9BACT|nr:RHS repeat-associated core domain-containing protein [Sedimentisphaera cyanobacteriorum]AQQ09696.1 RHS repeat-associated core domain protein [Sedimentisphaera cyanobacteriorum]